MGQISQQMSSNKFTMDDLKKAEITWKTIVVQNEISLLKAYQQSGELYLAYEKAERNAWIVKTLRDKKQRFKFDSCKNLVMIGSGLYPYSMFDVHKQYPHIKQIGLEIIKNRVTISKKLIKASPAKDSIKILHMDALNFDYSWLGMDDLIFISVDVDHENITKKILETSKAQLYMCAPYEKTWIRSMIQRSANDLRLID